MNQPRLEDYPFDASLPLRDVYRLHGLDKLRCVEDPGTRERLFELYQQVVVPAPINPRHWNDQ